MKSTKTAIAEEVWALIRENAEGMKELRKAQQKTEEEQRKTEKARREGERALREAQQRTEEARRKGEQALREALRKAHLQTQKEVRELNQSLKERGGNFNNKWGHFLENLLEDDLVKLLNEQNIKVEEVFPRLVVKKSGVVTGEYDLVAVNGEEVVVFEVKTTLRERPCRTFFKETCGL